MSSSLSLMHRCITYSLTNSSLQNSLVCEKHIADSISMRFAPDRPDILQCVEIQIITHTIAEIYLTIILFTKVNSV